MDIVIDVAACATVLDACFQYGGVNRYIDFFQDAAKRGRQKKSTS